jgi:hypothetical protein
MPFDPLVLLTLGVFMVMLLGCLGMAFMGDRDGGAGPSRRTRT